MRGTAMTVKVIALYSGRVRIVPAVLQSYNTVELPTTVVFRAVKK